MTEELKILREYLQRQGLKNTSQREVILKVFLESPKHLAVDELAKRVQDVDSKIGYSTVYRTLKLFAECGLARESHFMHGRTIFEPGLGAEEHDHLVSMDSERVEEFHHDLIQAVQDRICRDTNFKAEFRRLEIYGEFDSRPEPLEGKAEILRRLNDALEAEMTGVSRYLHHSFLVRARGDEKTAAEFMENVEESTGHARLIGDLIVAEGGKPQVKILEVFKDDSLSVLEMVKLNLGYEKKARDTYKEILPLAKGYPQVEELMLRLIKEESEHAASIEKLVEKMEKKG